MTRFPTVRLLKRNFQWNFGQNREFKHSWTYMEIKGCVFALVWWPNGKAHDVCLPL